MSTSAKSTGIDVAALRLGRALLSSTRVHLWLHQNVFDRFTSILDDNLDRHEVAIINRLSGAIGS